MSTSLTLPRSQWTPIATNIWWANGDFSLIVPSAVNPSVPNQRYLLQVHWGRPDGASVLASRFILQILFILSKDYYDRINKMYKMGKTSCKFCLPRRSHPPLDEG